MKIKVTPIRVLATLAMIFISVDLYSQTNKVNSDNIVYKAKLLTLSPYGVNNPDSILSELKNQTDTVYYTSNNKFLVIKIVFKQTYIAKYDATHEGGLLCNESFDHNCTFLIVYSTITKRYYKIMGFTECDFKLLYDDCKANFVSAIGVFLTDDEALIDYDCYYKRYIKRRKSVKCFEPCNSCSQYIVY